MRERYKEHEFIPPPEILERMREIREQQRTLETAPQEPEQKDWGG